MVNNVAFEFQEADLNGDGTIDKEEFINVFDTLFGLQGKVKPRPRGFSLLATTKSDKHKVCGTATTE